MKLNFITAYYAVVSIVSVLVLGFALVDLLQFMVVTIWPQLADADLARLAEMQGDSKEFDNYLQHRIRPLYTDLIRNCVTIIIFSGLLWWHLPRLLRSGTNSG